MRIRLARPTPAWPHLEAAARVRPAVIGAWRTRVVRHRPPQVRGERAGDRAPTQDAIVPARLESGCNWR